MRSFFLRRTRIDVCESPVTLEVDKSGVGTFSSISILVILAAPLP